MTPLSQGTPFGMLMPGRKYSAGSLYRYGFNGKENDNEVDGEGGQQDYGMRIYDPRIGRFLSVDPIRKDYPELTPYQFSSNVPILGIDKDGLEFNTNNFLFDIWLNWKFGDPTGAKTLVTGAVEKTTTETGQNSYHNENVPEPVQHRLDLNSNREAGAKIAGGSANVVTFNIQTSAEITSNIAPLGEGFSMAFGNLRKLSPARFVRPDYSAKMAAMDQAILESMLPTKPSFKVVTATEGGGFIRINFNGYHHPKNLAESLGLPGKSLERWKSALQCAEPKALNDILLLGVPKNTVTSATFGLKAGKTYRLNVNNSIPGSTFTLKPSINYTKGFETLNYSSGRTVAPKAPCSNCNITLKGTKTIN